MSFSPSRANVSESGEGFWFSKGASPPSVFPFNTFLFKIASGCNLACPYCYVYELRDQGWRAQPPFMQQSTYKTALARIRTHVVAQGVPVTSLIFHGGEPLLVGPQSLDDFATEARECLADVTEVRIGLQSNGTLFNERFLEVALRHRIRVGLSIDGPPSQHDKLRRYRNGRGSSRAVERAAKLLEQHPDAFGGLLCVVNLENDPAEAWEYLCSFHPPGIDLLLPHATHDHLPPGITSPSEIVRYGHWLVRVLELWYGKGDDRPDIRLFSSIMRLLLGRDSLVETIGNCPAGLIVIESNGELEAVDALKACYHGAAYTGLNVFEHTLDQALSAPAIKSRHMGAASLCSTCQKCSFRDTCGAGYQPHRYSSRRGFQNPSVYCQALMVLIRRVALLMEEEFCSIGLPVPGRVQALAHQHLGAADA